MIANMLDGFEEFKNTKASKKAIENGDTSNIELTVRLASGWKGKKEINVTFSKALVRMMYEKKLTTFKLLYNEKENAIGIRYDNSSNCLNLDNFTIQKSGIIMLRDKFITFTFVPLLEKENCLGYKYKGRYFEMNSCIVFRNPKKIK